MMTGQASESVGSSETPDNLGRASSEQVDSGFSLPIKHSGASEPHVCLLLLLGSMQVTSGDPWGIIYLAVAFLLPSTPSPFQSLLEFH